MLVLDRLHEDKLVPRGHFVLGPESLESFVVVHDGGGVRSGLLGLIGGGVLVLGAASTTQTVKLEGLGRHGRIVFR